MNVRFKSTSPLKSCYRDLNSGPLPYQGSALPLSYNSEHRAENGAQTRDPQLGRLVLYQLSYFRKMVSRHCLSTRIFRFRLALNASILTSFPEVGGDGFEPPKSKDNRFTVCPIWPLWKPPSIFALFQYQASHVTDRLFRASCRIRTNDPEITNHVLWPTELKRLH